MRRRTRAAQENSSSLDDKPFSSHKGTVEANKNRSVCLTAITLDVAIKLQRTVGKFDIPEASAPYVTHFRFAISLVHKPIILFHI